jgi:hypothetical protein
MGFPTKVQLIQRELAEKKGPESWAPAYNSRNGCGGQI